MNRYRIGGKEEEEKEEEEEEEEEEEDEEKEKEEKEEGKEEEERKGLRCGLLSDFQLVHGPKRTWDARTRTDKDDGQIRMVRTRSNAEGYIRLNMWIYHRYSRPPL